MRVILSPSRDVSRFPNSLENRQIVVISTKLQSRTFRYIRIRTLWRRWSCRIRCWTRCRRRWPRSRRRRKRRTSRRPSNSTRLVRTIRRRARCAWSRCRAGWRRLLCWRGWSCAHPIHHPRSPPKRRAHAPSPRTTPKSHVGIQKPKLGNSFSKIFKFQHHFIQIWNKICYDLATLCCSELTHGKVD